MRIILNNNEDLQYVVSFSFELSVVLELGAVRCGGLRTRVWS